MARKKENIVVLKESPYVLIGISSSENDYRLSWLINNSLKLKLTKADSLLIVKGDCEINFSVFNYSDSSLNYSLISNKSPKGTLMDELKNVDFWFKIEGNTTEHEIQSLKKNLKKTEGILAIFEINPEELKSKFKLL
jgi:hypothetical protein